MSRAVSLNSVGLISYRAVQVREVGIYQANIYKWIEKHLLVSLQVTNPGR
jgi:hypothetical protein